MALSVQAQAYLDQLGELIVYVDPRGDTPGPHGTVSYRLVPTSGWHKGERFPHKVHEEVKHQGFDKTALEGNEYYLVPHDTTNTPGTISHYAQRTGRADLVNPPEAGVNRARDTFAQMGDYSQHTAAPDVVEKYVKEHDNWEEARKREDEKDIQVRRAIREGEGDVNVSRRGRRSE